VLAALAGGVGGQRRRHLWSGRAVVIGETRSGKPSPSHGFTLAAPAGLPDAQAGAPRAPPGALACSFLAPNTATAKQVEA